MIALEAGFKFGAVDGVRAAPAAAPPAAHALDALVARPVDALHPAAIPGLPIRLPINPTPPLGPLAPMVGSWKGSGFNTIFRPLNPNSPVDPKIFPVKPTGDNVLELNLTSESTTFTAIEGDIPNRGMVMPDINLHGMIYLQQINDVTTSPNVGIHIEPGIWVVIPPTTDPSAGQTVCRMASIPHGTTINAQGTTTVIAGPPTIPAVDITPIILSTGNHFKFPSQTATNQGTPRIPQDLTPFITSEKITQAMLDDPNSVLRNAIAGQKIISTTQVSISTDLVPPIASGGGTDNIAFLLNGGEGQDKINNPASPNANAIRMNATFWIETVERDITIPIFKVGDPHVELPLPVTHGGGPLKLTIDPARPVTKPVTIKLRFTQIQYTQTVFLNFNGLSWPHVSVATLVPSGPVVVPPAAWPA
ncbi:MAG TPA: heme-binding protein [Kofleriaceae bacterium]|nr:heme-binding protein [Kofleriaceae bacterium]